MKLPLTTERLLLRDFRESDWQAVHEYASDSEVTRYTTFGPNTEEETRAFLHTTLAVAREQPRRSYTFAVVQRSDDRLIGVCGLHRTNDATREAELAYILNRSSWGNGYMPEAAQAVLAFGFTELGLHRIIARCNPRNTASERVMQKIGMQREGLLRESAWIKNEWTDLLLYAILDRDWQGRSSPGADAQT